MSKKSLTDKQRGVADEIVKGLNPTEAVLKVYNCGGIDPRASAKVILSKLRGSGLFNDYLTYQQNLAKAVVVNEIGKIAPILETLFPKIERAKLLITIAQEGGLKEKLEVLKELNRISDEYPIEQQSKIDIGELRITMSAPKIETIRGEVIEQIPPKDEETAQD